VRLALPFLKAGEISRKTKRRERLQIRESKTLISRSTPQGIRERGGGKSLERKYFIPKLWRCAKEKRFRLTKGERRKDERGTANKKKRKIIDHYDAETGLNAINPSKKEKKVQTTVFLDSLTKIVRRAYGNE